MMMKVSISLFENKITTWAQRMMKTPILTLTTFIQLLIGIFKKKANYYKFNAMRKIMRL
jgi:hypothetical protein